MISKFLVNILRRKNKKSAYLLPALIYHHTAQSFRGDIGGYEDAQGYGDFGIFGWLGSIFIICFIIIIIFNFLKYICEEIAAEVIRLYSKMLGLFKKNNDSKLNKQPQPTNRKEVDYLKYPPSSNSTNVGKITSKITSSDNTEKIKAERLAALQAEREEKKAHSIDRTAEGWIYNASQKRLYNKSTGEDLYTYDALGFSIAKDCFVLYNRVEERRISKDCVRSE